MSVKIMSRVWEKSQQGGSQLLLLLAIADNANDYGFAWPGQKYLAQKIRMSDRSIPRLAAKLEKTGELFVHSRGDTGQVTQYIVTTDMPLADFKAALIHLKYNKAQTAEAIKKFSKKGGVTNCQGRQAVGGDIAVSGGVDIAVSGGVDIAVSTEPSITIIEPSIKDSSADAEHRRPVSLLSEKEIKILKLPLPKWREYLVDEQKEKGRKGVIKFIEDKIQSWLLQPRNDAEIIFFDILTTEYDAKGWNPPKEFPTTETKRLFNEAAEFHNGTLEQAIKKAIHKRGRGIVPIVDYINSPEWRKGQTNGQEKRGKTGSQGSSGQAAGNGFQPGNGRTPEMQARLEAAFAPKPG